VRLSLALGCTLPVKSVRQCQQKPWKSNIPQTKHGHANLRDTSHGHQLSRGHDGGVDSNPQENRQDKFVGHLQVQGRQECLGGVRRNGLDYGMGWVVGRLLCNLNHHILLKDVWRNEYPEDIVQEKTAKRNGCYL
jgi:hypothetical protein